MLYVEIGSWVGLHFHSALELCTWMETFNWLTLWNPVFLLALKSKKPKLSTRRIKRGDERALWVTSDHQDWLSSSQMRLRSLFFFFLTQVWRLLWFECLETGHTSQLIEGYREKGKKVIKSPRRMSPFYSTGRYFPPLPLSRRAGHDRSFTLDKRATQVSGGLWRLIWHFWAPTTAGVILIQETAEFISSMSAGWEWGGRWGMVWGPFLGFIRG